MKDIAIAAEDERRYQRWLDVRYGRAFNHLNARLYQRMATTINALQIAAGAATVAAAFASWDLGLKALGATVAVAAATAIVLDPAARAARFEAHARRYGELDIRADTLAIDDLERELHVLQQEALPGEIAALAPVAYNRNLQQNGRDDAQMPASVFERLVAAFA